MPDRVGFVGMGIMGRGMVANLAAKGHDPLAWNRTSGKVPDGVKEASSLPELVERSDVIMICVSDSPDVVDVIDAVRPNLRKGQLIVDHSTISPQTTRELAASLDQVGWLDAPVSGGSEGAARGTLSTMVGGTVDDFERARPLLEAYSQTITHMGAVGTGQLTKLVNQILVVGNQMAASEALFFAEAAGLDLSKTLEAVKSGAGGSWMLANRGPQMIADDWRPGFTVDLQQKDLRLVLAAAEKLGTQLPATSLISALYRQLQDSGHGAEGNHALIKALKEGAP